MSKCVFITGGNCVGKTTLAKVLINHYGGVERINGGITFCKDKRACLAGEYKEGSKYGGVDRLKNENGSSCTKVLPDIVEKALKTRELIICEGSYMNTFGLNMTNAMFKADEYLVINLYMPYKCIIERILKRSNGKNGVRTAENMKRVLQKNRQSMIAAKKWQSIGVKVIQIDTSVVGIDDVLKIAISAIDV